MHYDQTKTAAENLMALVELNQKNSFGEWANLIQDIAMDVPSMTEDHWDMIYDRMEADVQDTEGQDGILINGNYYDWRQFETQRNDMIRDYLRYFDDQTLKEVYVELIARLIAKRS